MNMLEFIDFFKEKPNKKCTATHTETGALTNSLLRVQHRKYYEILSFLPIFSDKKCESGSISTCQHVSVSPLGTLKRISISEIPDTFTATEGCYLLLRNLEHPIAVIGIKTMVEDHTGKVAHFTAFNFFSHSSGMRAEDAFPVGTIFILKEPVLKETEAGNVIHCDCPSNIVVLSKHHKYYNLAKEVSWKNQLGITEERDPTSIEGWKTAGNSYFKRNMLPKALEAYFMALNLTGNDDCPTKDILNSNISATYLKMGYFESALQHAEYALEREPRNLKALFRTGRAHYELRQYEESFQAFKRALEIDPINHDVKTEFERACLRLEEQSGNYDIYKLFLTSNLKPKTKIDCADYTGPLKIVPIPGKGRGLVATEDIKPGTLLLVSKALHINYDDSSDLVCKTAQTVLKNPVVLGKKIYDLSTSDEGHCQEENGENTIVDVVRINKIIRANSLRIGRNYKSDIVYEGKGLFLNASYFNHSCIANANWDTYNDVMVVFAVKPIDCGEEVTICCYSHAMIEQLRNSYFSEASFQCTCLMCQSDREEGTENLKIRSELFQQVYTLQRRPPGVSIESSVKKIERLLKKIEDTYKSNTDVPKYSLFIPFSYLSMSMAELNKPKESLKYAEKALNAVGLDMDSLLEFSECGTPLPKQCLPSSIWHTIVFHILNDYFSIGMKAEGKTWFKVLVRLEKTFSGGIEQMVKKKHVHGATADEQRANVSMLEQVLK